MAVIKLEPSTGIEPRTMEQIGQMMQAAILPENKNINLKTFDDVLDCMFIVRAKLAELYEQDIQNERENIRQDEKDKLLAEQDKLAEALIRKEKNLKVDSAGTLRTIIKTVTAYDWLNNNRLISKDEFIGYCAGLGISEVLAGQIYMSRCFDIETRRRLISENYALLADE